MSSLPQYFDVMNILRDGGLGTPGIDLFCGEWGHKDSDEIDSQVLVLNGAGEPSTHRAIYEMVGIQILVRGLRVQADIDVYEKAKQISDYILSLPEGVCAEGYGTGYQGFEESSNIAALGKDNNERFIYSMNFTAYRNR